jgi:hypothetical protein
VSLCTSVCVFVFECVRVSVCIGMRFPRKVKPVALTYKTIISFLPQSPNFTTKEKLTAVFGI